MNMMKLCVKFHEAAIYGHGTKAEKRTFLVFPSNYGEVLVHAAGALSTALVACLVVDWRSRTVPVSTPLLNGLHQASSHL